MPRFYDWKNIHTGEIVTTEFYDVPPCCENSDCTARSEGVDCEWKRIFSFGVSAVMGAGSSPARRVSQK